MLNEGRPTSSILLALAAWITYLHQYANVIADDRRDEIVALAHSVFASGTFDCIDSHLPDKKFTIADSRCNSVRAFFTATLPSLTEAMAYESFVQQVVQNLTSIENDGIASCFSSL